MIQIINPLKEYPSKSIIEDIAFRTGPATDDCYTPFDGCAHILNKQYKGIAATYFDAKTFLRGDHNDDFSPLEISSRPCEFLEDLPDMEEVEKYLNYYCTGYKNHNGTTYKANRFGYAAALEQDNNTGEWVSPAMRETYFENRDLSRIEAYERAPYVIKRLWEYSLLMSVNLFEMAVVFKRLTEDGMVRKLTRSSFQYFNFHKLGRDGEVVKIFEHAKDLKCDYYGPALDLFVIPEPATLTDVQKKAKSIAMEYLQILDTLGIKADDESRAVYDKQYCESLRCLYIPTDEDADVADLIFNNALTTTNFFKKKSDIIGGVVYMPDEEDSVHMELLRKAYDSILSIREAEEMEDYANTEEPLYLATVRAIIENTSDLNGLDVNDFNVYNELVTYDGEVAFISPEGVVPLLGTYVENVVIASDGSILTCVEYCGQYIVYRLSRKDVLGYYDSEVYTAQWRELSRTA